MKWYTVIAFWDRQHIRVLSCSMAAALNAIDWHILRWYATDEWLNTGWYIDFILAAFLLLVYASNDVLNLALDIWPRDWLLCSGIYGRPSFWFSDCGSWMIDHDRTYKRWLIIILAALDTVVLAWMIGCTRIRDCELAARKRVKIAHW